MKVSKPKGKVTRVASERDKALSIRLGFLRQARHETLQRLADTNGTQRSNLSAFVTSGGKIRNISYEKLDRILYSLGLLQDATLTPGLHRWQIDASMVTQMCAILTANDFQSALLMKLSSGNGVFLVVKVAGNILVLANIETGALNEVKKGFEKVTDRMRVVTLDRAGDSSIQSFWMTEDDVRVEKLLLSLFQS